MEWLIAGSLLSLLIFMAVLAERHDKRKGRPFHRHSHYRRNGRK